MHFRKSAVRIITAPSERRRHRRMRKRHAARSDNKRPPRLRKRDKIFRAKSGAAD